MATASAQEPAGASDDARRGARETLERKINAGSDSVLARLVGETVITSTRRSSMSHAHAPVGAYPQ